MKCSPFSKSFSHRGGKHHLRRRLRGPVLRHLVGDRDTHHRMEEDHHMHHKMGHGHHKIGHGHHLHHRMGHGMHHRMGHDMHHRMGHDMHHRMGHDMHRRMGHDMHHRMGHGHDKHHKIGHDHGKPHKIGHGKRRFPGFLQEDLENTDKCCEKSKDLKGAASTYEPKSKAQVTRENNTFQISLDISHYQPNEVSVKIVSGKIDVSAIHESMEEDLYEFHEIYRSFSLPDDVRPDAVTSSLDSNGMLIIGAPLNTEEEDSSIVRDVPVVQLEE